MTFFDFCVAITIGSVTANIGFGGDSSFHSAVAVLITLGLLAIITGYFHIDYCPDTWGRLCCAAVLHNMV
jgi:uncharacterized membrane protein YcaP (DUF421 family)